MENYSMLMNPLHLKYIDNSENNVREGRIVQEAQ